MLTRSRHLLVALAAVALWATVAGTVTGPARMHGQTVLGILCFAGGVLVSAASLALHHLGRGSTLRN